MSIIGNPIITTNYVSDTFSGDGSTVAFTLSQAPASAASIAVYISGLYQNPTSAYTISGTTLTFTGAPPLGTNNIYVLHLGVKSATLVPVAGSVTPSMLSNNTAIYWSVSNNNVGFGNSAPIAPVQVGSLGASYTVNPSNPLAIFASNINNYNQITTQNANSGTNASNDLIVSNDLGTDSTNYGDFGINSSGFSGSGAFADPSGVYLYAQSNTLAIGTASASSLKLATNNAVAMTVAANGNVGIGNVTPTSLLTVTGTTALGNTTITGTANVTSDVYVGGYFSVNSTPTTGYRVTIDNGSATTGDYSPLLLKGGSVSENGGQLGFWNTYAGVSNPKKWIRVDNSGRLAVVNSGYNTQIFSLDDSGNLSTGGTITSSSRGIAKASMPSGTVLQVLQAYKTDTFSTASTSLQDVSGLSITITPSSSSSKFLIMVNLTYIDSFYVGHIGLIRNGTEIGMADAAGSRPRNFMVYSHETNSQGDGPYFRESMNYLDSPGTGSAITYKIQASARRDGQGGTMYINRTVTDRDTSGYDPRATSSIVVMEIAQ